jgi:hypothetical protein
MALEAAGYSSEKKSKSVKTYEQIFIISKFLTRLAPIIRSKANIIKTMLNEALMASDQV